MGASDAKEAGGDGEGLEEHGETREMDEELGQWTWQRLVFISQMLEKMQSPNRMRTCPVMAKNFLFFSLFGSPADIDQARSAKTSAETASVRALHRQSML